MYSYCGPRCLCPVFSLPAPMTTNGSLFVPDHLFSFFFFFFLFLFSSQATLFSPQATLFSPYPSTINTTHYSHSSSLPLQLKLKSSFCSISVSAVGLVGCGYLLSRQWVSLFPSSFCSSLYLLFLGCG